MEGREKAAFQDRGGWVEGRTGRAGSRKQGRTYFQSSGLKGDTGQKMALGGTGGGLPQG